MHALSPSSSSGHGARPAFDQLIQDAVEDGESFEDNEEAILIPSSDSEAEEASARRRAAIVRGIALLCACWLSVGSHYASYILGPIKTRLSRELGTSHTQFSLLISALSLNSTWTPLVGGLLASRLGTTTTSILATGVILCGQILLLIGDITGSIKLMTLGMFTFGLGVSPLAVVQETIIVRFFKQHGLGVSMAIGLLAGKGASFVSARTSYPLTTHFGTRAPFWVATILAGTSFAINLVYIAVSKWLVAESGAILEAPDISEEADRRRSVHNLTEAEALEKVAQKKRVDLKQVTKLGDVFWSYVGLNVFCGMIWHPFTHLAPNIIEKRYGLTEMEASNQASWLLAGSVVLYPIVGYIVDSVKGRPIVIILLLTSSLLTFLAYSWLALPPEWTRTAWPGIISYAIGQGFAPLLLVVIVPQIVGLKYVSTALGIHKSLEQTGSVLSQTLAGLALDSHPQDKGHSIQWLMNAFWFFNILQFVSILGMWALRRRQITSRSRRRRESQPLLGNESEQAAPEEVARGRVFAFGSLAMVLVAWMLFLGTAWFRLGSHKPKGI